MKKVLCGGIYFVVSSIIAASITGISSRLDSDGYQIIFKDAGVEPTTFSTQNPASIVLDFPNTLSTLTQREKDINQNGIYSVSVIPREEKTRAVLNLAIPMNYKTKMVGKDVHVTVPVSKHIEVKNQSVSNSLLNKPAVALSQPILKKVTSPAAAGLNPTFHKNGEKGGALSFTLPSSDTMVMVRTEGSSIIATLPNYSVSKQEQKRMDVADYGSPVRYVDILHKGADTHITVNMGRNAYEYVTYQNDRIYTIEITKPDENEAIRHAQSLTGFGANKQYKGAPLSLNFQDIEVRAVLQIIAEFTNSNIVVSDSVVGNITLRLDNVPWDQALDIIIKTKSLAMRKSGSVIYIAPESELNKSEIEALADYQRKQELLPSHTELVQVKYAKASDLAKIIENSRKSRSDDPQVKSTQDAVLSSKGSIAVDERTNTLLVSDIPEKIQAVRDLVTRLDEPVRQVLIDSRLVITNDQFSRDLGARFGVGFLGRKGNRHLVGGSGTLEGANIITSSGMTSGASLSDRLGVDLGATSAARAGSYGISILGSDFLVDLELQASQSEGRSEIISSPRVVTQDGYKALVSAGQEIPYSTANNNGTKTEFKDAKLSMEVTPRIAPNNRVSMEIRITKDRANYSSLVNGEPPLDTNEVNTKVEVENGETIVLGGIYEQTQGIHVNKVPLLGDIPILGNAFKNTEKTFNKNELLIFITPRIIESRLTEVDKFSNLQH